MAREAPYGTWESPLTTGLLAGKTISLDEVKVNEHIGTIYYLEGRPAQNGRNCIVEYSKVGSKGILPKGYSARTALHEYGGAAYTVGSDGILIFSDWKTRGVFSLDPSSSEVQAITENDPGIRYAAFNVHPNTPHLIIAVQEDHHAAVENRLVLIDADTKIIRTVAQGADFYSDPSFSPSGDRLCWIQWNHPDMPWTGSVLYVADWHDTHFSTPVAVAGNSGSESVIHPRWGPDGTLFFSSDYTGYYQLHRLGKGKPQAQILNLKGLEHGEFAGLSFRLGINSYVPLTANTLLATYQKNATSHAVIINAEEESYQDLELPLVQISQMARISGNSIVLIGATKSLPMALYRVDVTQPCTLEGLKSSIDMRLPRGMLSIPQHISFLQTDGDFREHLSHAVFLPPTNPNFKATPGTLPPLVVYLHGGPTSHVTTGLSMSAQYWTSRGYAHVSVNYAGSTSYGRAYRDLLNGRWGVLDVADIAGCVSYLSKTGQIDHKRVGIYGGSAGGYGVLQALSTYPALWASGISLYGISSLPALAKDTHKYESYYLDGLLFKHGATKEEQEKILHDRSPLNHADRITAPVLLLQGTEDKVVPLNQTLEMEKSIKEKGGTVKVIIFKGEGHGFRREENIMRSLQEQNDWFYDTLVQPRSGR